MTAEPPAAFPARPRFFRLSSHQIGTTRNGKPVIYIREREVNEAGELVGAAVAKGVVYAIKGTTHNRGRRHPHPRELGAAKITAPV